MRNAGVDDAAATRVRSGESTGALRSLWTLARALMRLLAFTASNLALAVLLLLGLAATAGNPAGRDRFRNWIFRAWSRVSLLCAGVHLEVRGRPPAGPGLLVANHIVYTDVWVLAAPTGAVFVAESGIARWPFFGVMAKAVSIIFVDRLNNRTLPKVNREMEAALRRGHVIALFPESRTSSGGALLPFRSPLLEPAARGGHPVFWAAIEYRTGANDPPASEVVVWPDGVSVASHAARFLRLDRVDARVTFGDGALHGTDRKALAVELREKVGTIFSPLE